MDTKNITAALAAFHQTVGTIDKTARAQYGNFADLSTVLSVITPALCKHGLALVQTFETDRYEENVIGDLLITKLLHTSGECIRSECRLIRVEGAGSRHNPLHLWGGSVTYQRRYAALALLGLAAGMDDDDGDIADAPRKVKAKQAKPRNDAPVTPKKVAPWDSREHAEDALGRCTSEAHMMAWSAKTKASKFVGVDRDALLEAYAERMAMVEA
jgi:hypothetical protein